MKCPKCGYLGFETTDRCRNCQYDFSLAPFSAEPDLSLRNKADPTPDFELPPIKRQTDALSATALDLDRLFGEPEPPSAPLTIDSEDLLRLEAPKSPHRPVAERIARTTPQTVDVEPEPEMVDEFVAPAPDPVPEIDTAPSLISAARSSFEAPEEIEAPRVMRAAEPERADDALPFDDAPAFVPPAARSPLAVRRSTPEVPRNRPRTTRPVRMEPLDLEPPSDPRTGETVRDAGETIASLMQAPSIGVRVGAGLIDVLLLLAVDVAVVYLTLRVTGLQNTLEDLRVLPAIPFVGFLAVIAFGYVAAFTVGGGQTIGKMMLNLRVIGDDGRPIDAAGGMLRAAGCMLVPITLGLSYLPAVFTSDHRALHDRLAGTRVVQE